MAKVKYPGVAFAAGETLIIPALSFRQLRDNAELLDRTGNPDLDAQARIEAKVAAIHVALTRNYPDITLEQVQDGFDLNTIAPAFEAALGASKEVKTLGED